MCNSIINTVIEYADNYQINKYSVSVTEISRLLLMLDQYETVLSKCQNYRADIRNMEFSEMNDNVSIYQLYELKYFILNPL